MSTFGGKADISRANSGIYFRCLDPKKITDRTCYEANIFDERPDPSYGTGAITRYVEVSPMPKAGDKWNTYEVTANGRDITVVLNGQATAKLRNGMFDEGPIALQHAAGAIKFRKVEVKPLLSRGEILTSKWKFPEVKSGYSKSASHAVRQSRSPTR